MPITWRPARSRQAATLGILIPPSTIMVNLRHHDRDQHRQAVSRRASCRAFSPPSLLCLTVQYVNWRDPKAGPPGERHGLARSRFAALEGLWAFAAVGVAVIGVAKLAGSTPMTRRWRECPAGCPPRTALPMLVSVMMP